jgi:prepilin-type N-terminal cleavage/methylation domain-containing protein
MRSGFSLLECMVAVAILALAVSSIMGLLSSQQQVRSSTVETRRYLEVARALRERFDSAPYMALGIDRDPGPSVSWLVARPLPDPPPWEDGVLGASDGGLDEQALIDLGIMTGTLGDGLRVYLSYRRAVSTETATGAFDAGWLSPGEVKTPEEPFRVESRWPIAENWDTAPASMAGGYPIAARITMVWKEQVGRQTSLGVPVGTGFRRHDVFLMRSP